MWKVGDVEPVRVALRAIPTASMSPPMTESRLSHLRMRLEPLPRLRRPRIGSAERNFGSSPLHQPGG